jgi:hypothetical protein
MFNKDTATTPVLPVWEDADRVRKIHDNCVSSCVGFF